MKRALKNLKKKKIKLNEHDRIMLCSANIFYYTNSGLMGEALDELKNLEGYIKIPNQQCFQNLIYEFIYFFDTS